MSHSRLGPAVTSFLAILCGGLALSVFAAPDDGKIREQQVEPPPVTVAERLTRKVTVDLRGLPLHKALDRIGAATDSAIVLDVEGLKQSGYTRNMRQELALRETPATGVLDAIVARYPTMTYVVDEMGKRVVVTTAANRAKFAEPTPTAAAAEEFDWSSLVTPDELDVEIDAIRTRVRLGTATPVAFGKSRADLVRDAGTLVVLAELAVVHGDASFHDQAGRLHAIGTRLRSSASLPGADGHRAARSAAEELEVLFTKPAQEAVPLADLEPSPLTDTMHRFDRFQGALRRSIDDPAQVARNRADLAREAALVAALAKLLTMRGESREDAGFAGHASELGDAALALRRGLGDEQPPAVIRTHLDVVTRVCSQCHADFR